MAFNLFSHIKYCNFKLKCLQEYKGFTQKIDHCNVESIFMYIYVYLLFLYS